MAIVKGSGLLMRAIIEEAPIPILEKMQVILILFFYFSFIFIFVRIEKIKLDYLNFRF